MSLPKFSLRNTTENTQKFDNYSKELSKLDVFSDSMASEFDEQIAEISRNRCGEQSQNNEPATSHNQQANSVPG